MMKIQLFLCILLIAYTVTHSLAVASKGKPSTSTNIVRKTKRMIRSMDATNFNNVYSKELEAYLSTSNGLIYDNLMKTIEKKARQLKVKFNADFAKKQVIVLPDIVDTAVGAGSFGTLVKAVQAAGLASVLKGTGPFTVLAPSDEAFAKLPEGTLDSLLADKEKLKAILTYHVIPGYVTSKKIVKEFNGKTAPTVNGKEVNIKVSKGDNIVTIDKSIITQADIKCGNGYIHVIDNVLIPSE